MTKAVLSIVAGLSLSSAAFAGGGWSEVGDAGQLVPTAQITSGVGSLDSIYGTLDGYDVDLYCIDIHEPSAFSASLVGGAAFDTQLFLFTAAGNGIAVNDDTSGSIFQSTLPMGHSLYASLPAGHYLLAVSAYDNDAHDLADNEIFPDVWFGPTVGPAGGVGPLDHWDNGAYNDGEYTVSLTGASYCNTPTPGSLALLGLGGVVAGSRRRR